jgi:hypothetical protein
MSDKPKIFVSHIHEESVLAAVIKNELEDAFAERIAVFVSSNPNDNPGGGNWLDRIAGELRDPQTCMLIALVSPIPIREPWISLELGAAWILKRTVFPMCHSGQELGQLPRPLGDFVGADLKHDNAATILIGAAETATGYKAPKGWSRDRLLAEMRQATTKLADQAVRMSSPGTLRRASASPTLKGHIDLTPEEVRILQTLAGQLNLGAEEVPSGDVPAMAKLKPADFAYHADKLRELRFIHLSVYSGGMDYRIMPPGIGWLKDHHAMPD